MEQREEKYAEEHGIPETALNTTHCRLLFSGREARYRLFFCRDDYTMERGERKGVNLVEKLASAGFSVVY